MSATKDFTVQSAAPSTISPSKVVLFADAASNICTIVSGGAPIQIGTNWSGTLNNTQVRTGTALYQLTGTYFGVAQGALFTTGLACPKIWVPIVYAGTTYALPAYALMP